VREVAAAGTTLAIAAAMSEAQLEEHIRSACKQLGILRFHVRHSLGTTAGLPDDILIGPNGLLWRECKTAKGKLTPAQQKTGEALTAAGQDWATWRPGDWLSGRIARELAAIAGRPGESWAARVATAHLLAGEAGYGTLPGGPDAALPPRPTPPVRPPDGPRGLLVPAAGRPRVRHVQGAAAHRRGVGGL
jgi:hypothetical protein